ncbi:MAG: helix-turn-helix domain-containing protein [Clostridia bacterium]|nr:helix-turn-helix domain-containing protein [Clostridia bacterium]
MSRQKQRAVECRSYDLSPTLPILVLSGEKWYISPVRNQVLHFHNCLEIGLCRTHSGMMEFGEETHAFHAGDLTCIGKNVPHTTYSSPGESSLWTYLFLDPVGMMETSGIQALADDQQLHNMIANSRMILNEEKARDLRLLFDQIVTELEEREPGYEWTVRGLCLSLMMKLLRIWTKVRDVRFMKTDHVSPLAPALDFIRSHYMENFHQEKLAEICHLSPTHFRRLFHEQLGTTPLTYLHRTRILESCSLLRSGRFTVSEVALMVGYATMSNYNFHFREIVGMPPTIWLKQSDGEMNMKVMSMSGWMEAETSEKLIAAVRETTGQSPESPLQMSMQEQSLCPPEEVSDPPADA